MSNSLRFSDIELQEILKQQLTGPHKDLLAEAIIGICDNDKKEILMKAAFGLCSKSVHPLYEQYKISKDHVSVYGIDYEESIQQGYIDENDELTCILQSYSPWETAQYKIEYSYIRDGKAYKTTYRTFPDYIKPLEEFPEDIIDFS